MIENNDISDFLHRVRKLLKTEVFRSYLYFKEKKMPKSIVVEPKEVRKPQILKLKDIPVNQYKSDFKKETNLYGTEKLKRIWYDMVVIREFETMLHNFKTQGVYNGIEYNHKGPAHLSLGQEASAVGECVNLTTDDFIFGSHRSHGEILAKCYSSLWQLTQNAEGEKKLEAIMKNFLEGETLAMAEKIPYKDLCDLAENFGQGRIIYLNVAPDLRMRFCRHRHA